MKFVTGLLKFVLVTFGVLVLALTGVLWMDQQRTEYLKPENRLPAFAEGAILLTNVQLVPMEQFLTCSMNVSHLRGL